MPITFRCPKCRAVLRVADDHAGKRAKCSKCATEIKIPSVQQIPGPSASVSGSHESAGTQQEQPGRWKATPACSDRRA